MRIENQEIVVKRLQLLESRTREPKELGTRSYLGFGNGIETDEDESDAFEHLLWLNLIEIGSVLGTSFKKGVGVGETLD